MPKRRLLVVCEGEKTEPQYLRGLERHIRRANLALEISRERGDPRQLVETAKRVRQRAQPGDYDEVWCVFDRDQHERFDEAFSMARDNGFELAVSNPCVELWLVLHFRESPGDQHRDKMKSMLKKFLPKYDKRVDFAKQFADGIDDATRRAERLDRDAEEMREPGRSPTTSFYRLTDSIRRND